MSPTKHFKTTRTFTHELPLRTLLSDERELNIRLECGRFLYNACLHEALKRHELAKVSRWWRKAQQEKKAKKRHRLYNRAFKHYRLSEYAIQSFGTKTKNACFIGERLDTHVCQTLATRAFKSVRLYSLGQGGRPRYKRKGWLSSLEGKSNASGIRWRDGKIEWNGLVLSAIFDQKDKDGIEAHALSYGVKYCRILRKKLRGRIRWFVHLILAGRPKIKGRNYAGRQTVGLDLGPSTIAIVSDTTASLLPFCEQLVPLKKQMTIFQRRMDRSRRATNPEHYHPDGTINIAAKTWPWHRSSRYRTTAAHAAELQRKLAVTRAALHGELANRVIRLGSDIRTEKLSYVAFQRQFGKSVGFRAPGTFMEILRRKAANAGGQVIEFPTQSTKLSQTCHCGKQVKKALSQRWHACSCGIGPVQRDLYSAFLARFVSVDQLDCRQAQQAWPGADPLLRHAQSSLPQPTSCQQRLGHPWGSPRVRVGRVSKRDRGSETSERLYGLVPESSENLRSLALRTHGLSHREDQRA